MPSFLAAAFLCILNIIQFVIVLSILLYYYPSFGDYFNKGIGLVLGVVVMGVNYMLFLYKREYNKIYKRFSSESKVSNIVGAVLALAFIFGCVWVAFKYSVPWIADNY